MNIREKLKAIQSELKAPKNQRNNFGGFNYRSCEDILEAVKPLLNKHNCILTLSDEVRLVGGRHYLASVAELACVESGELIHGCGYAREAEQKKGMDEAQISGACSSYARKYSLAGLFLLDDNKDPDTDHYTKTTKAEPATSKPKPEPGNKAQKKKAPVTKLIQKGIVRPEGLDDDYDETPPDKRIIHGSVAAAGQLWGEFKDTDLIRLYQSEKFKELNALSQWDLEKVLIARGKFEVSK